MTIASAISAAQTKIANAYSALSDKGVVTPSSQNLDNLTSTVNQITTAYYNFAVTGNPTINYGTGVVSSFSTSKYLSLPTSFNPSTNTWEIVFKVHTSSVSTEQYLFSFGTPTQDGTNRGVRLGIVSSKLQAGLSYDGSTLRAYINGSTTLSNNTDYVIKIEFTGSAYNIYVNNVLDGTLSSSTPISNGSLNYIGVHKGANFEKYWRGSIDLSASYIKINNQVWWSALTVAGGGSANITSLSVTPTTSAQTITASGGVDGYSPVNVSAVTSSIDANIVAGNIKDGVSILGVTGNYTGSGSWDGWIDTESNGKLPALKIRTPASLTTINTTALSGYYSNIPVSVADLSSIERITVSRGMFDMFINNTTLTSVNVSGLVSVTAHQGFCRLFQGCINLTSLDMSHLETATGAMCLHLMVAGNCGVTSLSFDSLTNCAGDAVFQDMCNGNTRMREIWFPALTASSFGNTYTNQFYNMLRGVTGCTVHFPASLQSVIGNWTDVLNGFGGTNTVVLFDLGAATINFTNPSNADIYVDGNLVVNNTTFGIDDVDYNAYLSSTSKLLFGEILNLVEGETRAVTVDMTQTSTPINLNVGTTGLTVNFIYDGVNYAATESSTGVYTINIIGGVGKTISYKINATPTTKEYNGSTTITNSSQTINVTLEPRPQENFTVVGSPVITNDYVASGFTSSDYLSTTLSNIPSDGFDLIIHWNIEDLGWLSRPAFGAISTGGWWGLYPDGAGLYTGYGEIKEGGWQQRTGKAWYLYRQKSDGLEMYYLQDDNDAYTLNTLPPVADWTLVATDSTTGLLANGNYRIGMNPDDIYWDQNWTGSIYLEDMVIRNTTTGTVYWKPLGAI